VHRNPRTAFAESAAEIRRVNQGGARGIELRHEDVRARDLAAICAAKPRIEAGLEGSRSGREISRVGRARDISVAVGVHGDPITVDTANATEVGGVDEGGARGIELRHEGIVLAAAEGGLEGSRRRREVVRTGPARDVRVAGGVYRDSATQVIPVAGDVGGTGVLPAAAEVGGVGEYRIDDERLAAIVRGHLKADPICP